MNLAVFSKRDLEDILGIIHDATMCKTEADLMRLLARLRDMLEADRGICGFGDKKGSMRVFNESFPCDWMQRYQDETMSVNDPVVHYVLTFFKPCLWSDATEVFSGTQFMELMAKASDYGLKHGVAGGVNGKSLDFGSIFSFSSTREKFGKRHKNMLDVVLPHLHQALARVSSAMPPRPVELSVREIEVLRWMKEGKTNWEISVILNISERTVKFHVHNIAIKLNAVSKSHAIAIAMDMGLVQ